jgi:3-hydroxyacyl-[acyl-carrier-protein] dehydratase
MRFLLVDRILRLERSKLATAVKNVTLSEDFFTHHFPDHPIMPGALITECLVQLADWVMRESTDFEQVALPEGFERVKFYRLVRPGDQLLLRVEIVERKDDTVVVKGDASCNGKVVAAALFSMRLHPAEPLQKPDDSRRIFEMIRASEEFS